ncbi:MAG: hypothetical protein P8H62_10585 [Henriciella sp.]|nr:hypothetical protein [Henriciella sp.]
MARLFDAYIIVDWSAASKPTTGANSIWVGVHVRNARLKFQFTAVNPKTRLEARKFITDMADKLIARGDKVLIGMDFAMGYPSGTADAIGLTKDGKAPWKAMHDHLASKVREREDNSNARFPLAAGMNYAMTKGPHPFWGTTKRDAVNTLATKKGDFSADGSLPEHRLAEAWIKQTFKANPKSVWQLLGAGAVGSQTLLGIPTVQFLRGEIKDSQIWPFETGFQPLSEDALENVTCVLAEIYPSTVSAVQNPGEVLDEAQVRTLAQHLQTLDDAGKLADAFGPPDSLDTRKIAQIEAEEGWILAK